MPIARDYFKLKHPLKAVNHSLGAPGGGLKVGEQEVKIKAKPMEYIEFFITSCSLCLQGRPMFGPVC